MKKPPVKNPLRAMVALLCLVASSMCFSFGETLSKKPNLLFIMTDQQRFDALSYAGNRVLKTPNMDRIAREGGWKLMRPDDSAENMQEALYNLNDDPNELDNLLATSPKSKSVKKKVAELEACFQDWIKRTSLNHR